MTNSEKPIGIFDSGVGGLTVFAALKRLLPREPLLYLGDTARLPYGTKSAETIVRYALEDAAFLMNAGVKAIVVACNTVSAHALPALAERCAVPLLGVLEPGAARAYHLSRARCIGVIGTSGTIESGAYERVLKRMDEHITVVSQACPLFVPLVEEGWHDDPATRSIAARYLAPLQAAKVDTLILGCTHYPLLTPLIREVMGPEVILVDSAAATAAALQTLLHERGLCGTKEARPDRLCVTDVPRQFATIARRFLGDGMPTVERVELLQ